MMNFSDEILMAYADGELDPALRGKVEQAMQNDPAVAAAVERHRALRADVFAAFARVLDEPVPERLQPHVKTKTPVQIDALKTAGARPLPARWSWTQWSAMAASLLVGVLTGALGWQSMHADGGAAPFARQDGTLVAQGDLARALSDQLASEQGQGRDVKLGVSFQAKDGSYCRSFSLGSAGGLACRTNGQWRIPVLAEGDTQHEGAYRQAASAMPTAVLDAIDQRIAGQALDATGERAARGQGWQRR